MIKNILRTSSGKAFLISQLLSNPFWGVLELLLPCIMVKELNASPMQITIMISLRPLTALLAFYWGSYIFYGPKRIKINLLSAYALKFIPFIFIPYYSNIWIFIILYGLHLLLLKGSEPPWMELLRTNFHPDEHKHLCSIHSSLKYLGNFIFPICFSMLLEYTTISWKYLFVITSLIGCISIIFLLKIPTNAPPSYTATTTNNILLKPWKESILILKNNPAFAKFQFGFFLGGAGLMIIRPMLPEYFTNHLSLSYTHITTAMCCCKAIGFVLSSPIWNRIFNRYNIFQFCATAPLLAAIFPLLLIWASVQYFYIFPAYLLYGIMQGNSELGWKMSGSIFSKNTDSAPYSTINVLMVGIRGLIFPYLGTLLYTQTTFSFVFIIGSILSMSAFLYLWKTSLETEKNLQTTF